MSLKANNIPSNVKHVHLIAICGTGMAALAAMLLAAAAQTARIGGEFEMMGGLMGEPTRLVKAATQDIMVPADAEVVIEGYIQPRHVRDEGPFGEYPWYYTGLGDRPVITVTGITMRKDAIWQDINAAHPEHNSLGMIPKAGSIWRNVRDAVPHAVKINLPMSGCARLHCYISLTKRADGEPKQAAFAAFAAEANLGLIILVDDDIDPFNEQEVLWAVATRFEAHEDLAIIKNALGAHLDPIASKGIDRRISDTRRIELIEPASAIVQHHRGYIGHRQQRLELVIPRQRAVHVVDTLGQRYTHLGDVRRGHGAVQSLGLAHLAGDDDFDASQLGRDGLGDAPLLELQRIDTALLRNDHRRAQLEGGGEPREGRARRGEA